MKLLIGALVLFLSISVWAGNVLAQDNFKTIRIDFKKMILSFESDNDGTVLKFPVALPRKNPPLPAKGFVKKVEVGAMWYPTQKTREYYLRTKKTELPKAIPPGHPLNAMGKGKITVVFEGQGIDPAVRIHETNDSHSIGMRVTRGCIRLKNEDFLKLAKFIEKEKVIVILE